MIVLNKFWNCTKKIYGIGCVRPKFYNCVECFIFAYTGFIKKKVAAVFQKRLSLKEKTKGKNAAEGLGAGVLKVLLPPAGPGQSLVGTWGQISQNTQFCVLDLKNT